MTNTTGPGPEEILKKHTTTGGNCDIIAAMTEYASLREREVAVAFAEWAVINFGAHAPGVIWYDLDTEKDLGTTSELYDGPYQQFLIESKKEGKG